MNKQTQVPIVGALILIVFAVAVLMYNEQKSTALDETIQNNASLLTRDYSPTVGNQNAKVTVVEFFDPACGTCKSFHPFVKSIMSAYPGKIRLVLRYTPFHKGSDNIVKLLEASRLQNKFWQTLEAMYNSQSEWASHQNPQPENVWRYIGDIGLDLTKAREDMRSATIAERVQQDMADAQVLNVTKTPGFFVNGKPLVQFGSKQLQQLIETAIQDNY